MEIKVPEVGESVHEALLAKWFKNNGDYVNKEEALCELETDKITLELNAEAGGLLSIMVAEGSTVAIGTVIATIAPQEAGIRPAGAVEQPAISPPQLEEEIRASVSSPSVRRELRSEGIAPAAVAGTGKGGRITSEDVSVQVREKTQRPEESPAPHDSPAAMTAAGPVSAPSPADVADKVDVGIPEPALSVHSENAPPYSAGRGEERRPMSPIRKRIAERLLSARQETAMLTTFNEADMSHVKLLREKYREHFLKRHSVPLGLMPFFVKACIEALREYPALNASIDANDIVYHHYYDIGIAIGGEKGLVVPVLRNAERLRMFEIDQAIAEFVDKIKNNRLTISDLEGGTFSISNGGVYGSLLSTPLLNPPQTGVLGMHAIQDRAVVRGGEIVIRPMMYLALSYDHRLIDGREAVGFLRKVKEYIEEPEELLLEA